MRLWPRSVRWQLIIGLMLLEVLSISLFVLMLVAQQAQEVSRRAGERLAHQSTSLALQAAEAFGQQKPDWMGSATRMMGEAPSVARATITDTAGNVLYASQGSPGGSPLVPAEKVQLARIKGSGSQVFSYGMDRWEGVKPIYTGNTLRGYAWVESARNWDGEQLNLMFRSAVKFGLIWIGASAVLVLLLSRGIAQPLATLHRGTRALMKGPEGQSRFPLPVPVENEFGDLIRAFNQMVASLEEQRSGLQDTLSLLDSMLANAPIGLVFFDRRCRIVRVNEVFAGMTGVPLSRHPGRTLPEILPHPVAEQMEQTVETVLRSEMPVHDVEVSGPVRGNRQTATWLVSSYPVRTQPEKIRWVGVIVLDASERKRSEETLRRTEKLAVAGRLAASIAHEINNPLEALTNLLYLLRSYCDLEEQARNYVAMAEDELRRMSEITQQTLRFYRQSTLPGRATMGDLLDSILSLYSMRMSTLGIETERRYDSGVALYCFAGEVRQVIANVVGNAIDATMRGGRLIVSARRSKDWRDSGREGVRITVADTGSGMEPGVRERIFEAFFTTKGATGTGLGLWVSREIILKHQGRMAVRSRTTGQGGPSGTVFQMFFPDRPEVAGSDLPVAAQGTEAAVAEM